MAYYNRIGSPINTAFPRSFGPFYSPRDMGGGSAPRQGHFRFSAADSRGGGGSDRISGVSKNPPIENKFELSLRAIPTNTGIAVGRALVVSSNPDFDSINEDDLSKEAAETKRPIEEIISARCERLENAVAEWKSMQVGNPDSAISNAQSALVDALLPDIEVRMSADKVSAITAAKCIIRELFGDNVTGEVAIKNVTELKKTLAEIYAIKMGKHVDVEGLIKACGFRKIVLVTHDLSPTSNFYSNDKVVGLIRERGGTTDHSSLMASAHDIVSVSHATGAEARIRTGDFVMLNTSEVLPVIVNPTAITIREAKKKKKMIDQAMQSAQKLRGQTVYNPVTGKPASFMVNVSSLQDINHALSNETDGMGLARSEYFFMTDEAGEKREEEPSIADQSSYYNFMQSSSAGKELVFRTIDVAAKVAGQDAVQKDKTLPYFDIVVDDPAEADGLALCLNINTPLNQCFRNQLEAIALSDLKKVMFPQVRSADEVAGAMNIIKSIYSRLESQGKRPNKNTMFGIMVENPFVLKDLKDICKRGDVSFLSIGTNDLTMAVTGISRYSESEQTYYEQQFSHGVRNAIRQTKEIADETGTPVSVCGNIVNDWRGFLMLLSMGFDRFSFSNPGNADVCRKIASAVDKESLEIMRANLEQIKTPHQVMKYIEQFARDKIEQGDWHLKDIWPYIQAVFASYSE